jgi:hypothetical protein
MREHAHLADTLNLIEEIAGTRPRPTPAPAAISPMSPSFRYPRSPGRISKIGQWRDRSPNICGYRGRPRHYGPCARSSSYACPRPRAIRLPNRLGAAIWAQAWAWLPASLQTLAALPDWPSRDKGADGRDGPIIGLAVRRSGREPEPCTSQTRRPGAHRLAARGRLRAAGQRAGAGEEIQGLAGDRDRIAQRLNKVVVHRLFAAGLGLQGGGPGWRSPRGWHDRPCHR